MAVGWSQLCCWLLVQHPVSPEFKVCFVLLPIANHHHQYGEAKKWLVSSPPLRPKFYIFCKPNHPSHLTPVLCASFTFLNSKATHLALPCINSGKNGNSNQQPVSNTLWQFNLDHLPTENVKFNSRLNYRNVHLRWTIEKTVVNSCCWVIHLSSQQF